MLKFRLYVDKDAEEFWLKEMSLKGWAFQRFCLGVYTFEACQPGEYNYQIDLLDNWDANQAPFADFMDESGVEVISQWYRWVYVRKRAADGPFELYTDAESKIAQYHRIKKFFGAGLVLEIACFLSQVNGALAMGSIFSWFITIFSALMGLSFLRMVWKCKWKIEQLQHHGI